MYLELISIYKPKTPHYPTSLSHLISSLMMNHCVPDFDIDHHDYLFPSISSSRKSISIQEDQVMELLWQNGQVRPNKLRTAVNGGGSSTPAVADAPQLFIQEDEMASWLHYPLDDEPQFDRDFCSDLLFPPPATAAAGSCTDTAVTDPVRSCRDRLPPPPKPPVPPTRRVDDEFRPHQGFGHFSRFRSRQEPLAGSVAANDFNSNQSASETVVESNATPAAKAGFVAGSSSVAVDGVAETTPLDFTVESSSGASGAEPVRLSACGDKKRKSREVDELDCHSQDVFVKAADTKKQVHGSTAKRTRAAEVHNLSERRRRDRINEKMKALQELIPRCNKSDKASMLDDAIEYLKSLQMQVQMMSIGCGMVPMMFPGMQQYMQPMGMGMGIDVNRPMMPFPIATPTHMGPGFPVPSYHPISPFASPDSSRIQVNCPGSLLNPSGTQNVYRQPVLTIPDQCQQYLGSQTMQQMQTPQSDATSLRVTSKSIPSRGPRPLPG